MTEKLGVTEKDAFGQKTSDWSGLAFDQLENTFPFLYRKGNIFSS